jgi:hypothetical protein
MDITQSSHSAFVNKYMPKMEWTWEGSAPSSSYCPRLLQSLPMSSSFGSITPCPFMLPPHLPRSPPELTQAQPPQCVVVVWRSGLEVPRWHLNISRCSPRTSSSTSVVSSYSSLESKYGGKTRGGSDSRSSIPSYLCRSLMSFLPSGCGSYI